MTEGTDDASPVIRHRGPPLPEPVFERLVNPFVRWLLRSRFHGLASDEVLLLDYTGRVSGRTYTVPVGYEAHDGDLYLTSQTDHVWWTNLRGGAPVTVRLRGEERSGTAEVIQDDRDVADYVDGYLDRHGLDAVNRLAIVVEGDERPDPRRSRPAWPRPSWSGSNWTTTADARKERLQPCRGTTGTCTGPIAPSRCRTADRTPEAAMADEPVLLDVEAGVATVTLNRPEKRNALSDDVSIALEGALAEVAESDARCLVVTGAGGAFSAGGDVDRMRRRVETDMPIDEAIRNVEQRTAGIVGRVYRFPIPTVAKIEGPAVGAGAGLALACDLQLAREDAKLGFVFRHVGLSCDAGTSFLLPRLVGANKAKELVLTGEVLDAGEALDLGLLNHVYPAETFDDRVDELVSTIADGPTVALRQAVRLIDAAGGKPLEDALADEAAAQGIALETADHEEGVAAFLEDREPAFEGR